VGAKWKDKSTIRSYTKPAYTDTPAQQVIRTGFGQLTHYLACFTAQLQGLSALNLRGQTIRNALVALNKDQVLAGELAPQQVKVSKGGLPPPSTMTATRSSPGEYLISWTAVTGPIISTKAKVVIAAAVVDGSLGAVTSALNTDGAATLSLGDDGTKTVLIYAYLLDYRGSSKVGSTSVVATVTV
jgi:hypothetical protein